MIPHDVITSGSNPRVRQAAALRDSDARRATGLTLVDGRRELSRAERAGVEIVELFIDADTVQQRGTTPADGDGGPDFDRWAGALAAAGTRIVMLSERAFEKVAFGSRNEGLVGVVRFQGRPLEDLRADATRPVLVVEGVEKPGNLGAILRTADAAAIAGVIVCDGRTDPANPAVIRASLGTVFTMPLGIGSSAAAIEWCERNARRVVAAMPAGERLWHDSSLDGCTALLLGSEAHGLSPLWNDAGQRGTIRFDSVRLPMAGVADSLNVSATAAVLAYEALRQRTAGRPPTAGSASKPGSKPGTTRKP
jgi:RNA methyltransferase, TrmH family